MQPLRFLFGKTHFILDFSIPLALLLHAIPAAAEENREKPRFNQLSGRHPVVSVPMVQTIGPLRFSIARLEAARLAYPNFGNQKRDQHFFVSNSDGEHGERPQPSIAQPIGIGLFFAAIGFFAGAGIGAGILGGSDDGEFSRFEGAIIGAPIGEATFMPVGVHLGNNRQGFFPIVFLNSLVVGGVGIWAASATDKDIHPAITLSATVIAQLLTCVSIERAGSRHRRSNLRE